VVYAARVAASNGISVLLAALRPVRTTAHSWMDASRIATTDSRKKAATPASMRSFTMRRCASATLATPLGSPPLVSDRWIRA